jgi:hypothetical protein
MLWQGKNNVKAQEAIVQLPATFGLQTLQIADLENEIAKPNTNSGIIFRQTRSCLNYEPEIVSLRGRLVRRTFINASNKRENVFLLELSKPICVNEDLNNEFNLQQKNVQRIQLALSDYRKAKKLVGKLVEAKGTLFGGHTQHHFTAVLLSVNQIKAI